MATTVRKSRAYRKEIKDQLENWLEYLREYNVKWAEKVAEYEAKRDEQDGYWRHHWTDSYIQQCVRNDLCGYNWLDDCSFTIKYENGEILHLCSTDEIPAKIRIHGIKNICMQNESTMMDFEHSEIWDRESYEDAITNPNYSSYYTEKLSEILVVDDLDEEYWKPFERA